jgi:hypothetical protein
MRVFVSLLGALGACVLALYLYLYFYVSLLAGM